MVGEKEFAGWFASNGSVIPPDNAHFQGTTDSCTFFSQAEHMFLWVTSPRAARTKGSYVFNSSPFYAVSPLEGTKRKFVPQDHSRPEQRSRASLSISQHGPGDEPVLFDDMGVMHRIVQIEGSGKPIGRIMPDKVPMFYDKAGDPIENPILRDLASGAVVELRPPPDNTISSNGHLFLLLDHADDAVAAEPGQADNYALMSQGNRLVYYMIHTNDAYAYFLTGAKNHKVTMSHFPTDDDELRLVKDYARDHGLKTFPDEMASIVELKSSWVELPHEKDYNQYVSIVADVPKFEKTDTHWHQKGWRRGVKLAMVGMHVAFSVKGHPELIWTTFEHVNNTPNAQYRYDAKDGSQPFSEQHCGTWLFSSGHAEPDPLMAHDCQGTTIPACPRSGDTVDASGTCVAANQPRMHVKDGDIYSDGGKIGPTDVLRINAWGNSKNKERQTADVISMNNSIWDRLAKRDVRDVRKQYMMIGAIWRGVSPTESRSVDCSQSSAQGSTCVANSSMETFEQPSNCLFCHKGPQNTPSDVSHVYTPLDPLPVR